MVDQCCTSKVPIACSLGPAELESRLGEFRNLAFQSLIRCERTAQGAVLVFREISGDTDRAVRALARAEKACCPFFEFAIETTDNNVRLEVNAPEEAQSFVDGLIETMVVIRRANS